MVTVLIIFGAAAATLAEWLHYRRCRGVARLAFADAGRGLRVVIAAAVARVAGLAVVLTALASLWESSSVVTNAVGAVADPGEMDRMIVIMDASNSMNIQDAGPDGQQTRAGRARDLIYQLVSGADRMPRTTLITFGESAIPVVYDAKDWDVLSGVLLRAYYSKSFESEGTAVDDAIRKSLEMAADWLSGSTVVVLATDGDSAPSADHFEIPPSIRQFIVLGVGSPEGRPAGKKLAEISRLEEGNLQRIAGLTGGDYFNANRDALSDEFVERVLPVPEPPVPPRTRRDRAVVLFGLSALLLAALPAALRLAQTRLMHEPIPRTIAR
jgi:hypothetical protein